MQKYLRPVLIFLFLPIFNFSSISYAQTSGQYLDTIYKLIDQKQYDDAIALVKKASSEYPQEMGFAVAAGEIYQLKGHYLTAIRNYLNIIETAATGDNKGEIAGWMHEHLIDAYNGLGMEHYFSKELCLRIIYHTEKSFELDPKILQDKKYIEFYAG